jgi:integrase
MTAVLRVAAKRGWCDRPAFERPRVFKPSTRWLTRDEAERLVVACAPHLKPLVTFLLQTGARLSEALRLQWAQVDLRARRVAFLGTKNGESRVVPLNGEAFFALANLPHREGHVFLTPAGVPYYDSGGLGGSPIKTGVQGSVQARRHRRPPRSRHAPHLRELAGHERNATPHRRRAAGTQVARDGASVLSPVPRTSSGCG